MSWPIKGISAVPGAPGPPRGGRSATVARIAPRANTWIGEQHAFLLGGGRAVLDHGETCTPSSVVMVIHRDLVITTFKVRVGAVDTENRAVLPCNVVSFRSLAPGA